MARQAEMIAKLPPTPCTPEMRDQVVAFADRERIAIAEVQRQALTLFFALRDSKPVTQSSIPRIHNREETPT